MPDINIILALNAIANIDNYQKNYVYLYFTLSGVGQCPDRKIHNVIQVHIDKLLFRNRDPTRISFSQRYREEKKTTRY